MDNSMEMSVVPEVDVTLGQTAGGIPGVPEGFSGEAGNFASDMAAIIAEQGGVAPAVQESPKPEEVAQPETPAPAPQVKAPEKAVEKFKNPDGTLNPEKIEKSTMSAEAALEKYLAKEKELRKAQANVNALSRGVQAPQQAPQQGQPSLEDQIEADLKAEGAGKVLVKLFNAAKQAAYEQARADIEGIALESEMTKRHRELESIAKLDPSVFSEDMFNRLSEIRQTRPWVNHSPEPWRAAYKEHLADSFLQQQQKQVGQVTPTPQRLTAPPTPVSAAPSASTSPKVNVNDKAALESYLSKLTPDQEKKFWGGLGFKKF